jgi:Animal haem peroxidase
MGTKHGQLMRGMEAAGNSDQTFKSFKTFKSFDGIFGARFGRLFPKSTAGQFKHDALVKLANHMVSPFDPPKDGPDDEESGIPALYTYLGQFIDHDITFDPTASFQKHKDPNATEDFRTPAFDLDNVYGRGPGDQPYLYQDDGISFLLGDPITQGSNDGARDLPRNARGRALIGDPRNDENSIVSQLQGLFLRFHNRLVHDALKKGQKPVFEHIQNQVRKTYQYLVINDFLPRIVSAAVLDKYRTNGRFDQTKLKVFKGFEIPFMPVEFSVAAYRLGHSMVRPGYRLNDTVLVPIFPVPVDVKPGFPEGLTGFRRLISDWAIDWGRFIDIDVRDYGSADDADKNPIASTPANFRRLQFAYRIDTALVTPLRHLPPTVASNPASLALRNLERGVEFGLPTGQEMAKLLHLPAKEILSDDNILIGQGVNNPPKGSLKPITETDPSFAGNCPLWTYILAEGIQHQALVDIPVKQAQKITTPQLGPVGGSIVAEVFLGLMFADKESYLSTQHHDPHWTPNGEKEYSLKDFVKFALEFKPPAP